MTDECWEASEEWYYVKNKEQQGPARVEELAVLYAKGKSGGITNESLIWCERLDDWTRLKELSVLLQLLQRPAAAAPPVPGPPQPAEEQQAFSAPGPPRPAAAPGNIGSSAPSSRSTLTLGSGPSTAMAPMNPRPAAAALANTAAAGRAGGTGNVAKKQSAIREFLLGWLPFRAPPKDLVRRGILHADPGGGPGGSSGDEIFGNELAAALRRPDTSSDGIPRVVSVLMDRLRRNNAEGIRAEGVFRVPGDQTEMRELRQLLNQGGDAEQVLDQCQNLHSTAGLLKMYFRELRPPLLTFELYDDFIRCSAEMGAPSGVGDVSTLRTLLTHLPDGHLTLLQHLIHFLNEVVSYGSESKMNAGNTAAVFAPNLLRPELETLEHLADTAHIVNLITVLIMNYERIFGTQPAPSQPSSRASTEAVVHRSASTEQVGYHGDSAQLSRSGPTSNSQASLMHSVSRGESLGVVSTTEQGVDAAEAPRSWFYLTHDHEQQGPVDWSQLQALFREMRIDTGTYVFTDGLSDWTLAQNLDMSGAEPPVS